jgi:DNA-binding transcriptional MerR regulator
MRVSQVAEKLTMELGMFVNLSRIDKYEVRGTIATPRVVGKFKEYTDTDVDRLRKVVVLSELGVPLMDIRKLILGIDVESIVASVKQRIVEIKKLVAIAESFFTAPAPQVKPAAPAPSVQPRPSGPQYK